MLCKLLKIILRMHIRGVHNLFLNTINAISKFKRTKITRYHKPNIESKENKSLLLL